MKLADTHCHLQDAKFDDDREDVIARALESLEFVVLSTDTLENSRRGLSLTREGVYCAVGIHPYHAADLTDEVVDELRRMSAEPRVVAIGETGLDYFKYCDTPRDVQFIAFRRQLELACEVGLPVIIHDRDAHDDCATILEEYADRLPGCIMHCFGGDAAFAERCLASGFYISFAGNVTFPKAQELRDAAAVVPMDKLLVETDSPYLAPQPRRGKRCEPAFVQFTAETVAEVKGVSVEALAEATTANAKRVFAL